MYEVHRGSNPAGSQVLENLAKVEADKSAGMLAFLISIFVVRKV
jgi:hypothetical protein